MMYGYFIIIVPKIYFFDFFLLLILYIIYLEIYCRSNIAPSWFWFCSVLTGVFI